MMVWLLGYALFWDSSRMMYLYSTDILESYK